MKINLCQLLLNKLTKLDRFGSQKIKKNKKTMSILEICNMLRTLTSYDKYFKSTNGMTPFKVH